MCTHTLYGDLYFVEIKRYIYIVVRYNDILDVVLVIATSDNGV